MIGMLKKISEKISDRALGRGAYSVSIPAMDGALQTNNLIEKAKRLAVGADVDNLVLCGGVVYFSNEKQLMKITAKKVIAIGEPFATHIIATASFNKQIAVVTAEGKIFIGKPSKLAMVKVDIKINNAHVTAIDFLDDKTLIICIGSQLNEPKSWTRDLMQKNKSGLVYSLDIVSGKSTIWASKLGFPAGVLVQNGCVIIAEAWRHRLVEISQNGLGKTVLSQLPGYPGRIKPDGSNGAILSVFAPRSQLIELVLHETNYRKRMMQEVPEHLWVAPSYSSGKSFLEPMQSGAVKIMGVLKPWAPTRSYGLVVRLDSNCQPISSFHSRADGNRHGITSAISVDKNLIISSKGTGEILKIDAETQRAQS